MNTSSPSKRVKRTKSSKDVIITQKEYNIQSKEISTPPRGTLETVVDGQENIPDDDDKTSPVEGLETYRSKESDGKEWTKRNINTIKSWLMVSMQQIDMLDRAIINYKNYIRWNVIWGLILSTASGTISASSLGASSSFSLGLNIVFMILSFFIAIGSGIIKIWQIQENLELYIKLKQDWTIFCLKIIAYLDKPISNRRNGMSIIKEYSPKYLELLKTEIDIPNGIKKQSEREVGKVITVLFNEDFLHNRKYNIKNLLSGKDLQTIIRNSIYKLYLEFKYLTNDGEIDDNKEEKIAVIMSGCNTIDFEQYNKYFDNGEIWCCGRKIRQGTIRYKISNGIFKCLHKIFIDPCGNKEIENNKIDCDKFLNGERVEINYRGSGKWYIGTIRGVNKKVNDYNKPTKLNGSNNTEVKAQNGKNINNNSSEITIDMDEQEDEEIISYNVEYDLDHEVEYAVPPKHIKKLVESEPKEEETKQENN